MCIYVYVCQLRHWWLKIINKCWKPNSIWIFQECNVWTLLLFYTYSRWIVVLLVLLTPRIITECCQYFVRKRWREGGGRAAKREGLGSRRSKKRCRISGGRKWRFCVSRLRYGYPKQPCLAFQTLHFWIPLYALDKLARCIFFHFIDQQLCRCCNDGNVDDDDDDINDNKKQKEKRGLKWHVFHLSPSLSKFLNLFSLAYSSHPPFLSR